MIEKRLIIIFDQHTGKGTTWQSPEGELLQIINVLNYTDCELKRMFINKTQFLELDIKGLFSKNNEAMKLLEVELEIDLENRERIKNISVLRFAKITLDKPLDVE